MEDFGVVVEASKDEAVRIVRASREGRDLGKVIESVKFWFTFKYIRYLCEVVLVVYCVQSGGGRMGGV